MEKMNFEQMEVIHGGQATLSNTVDSVDVDEYRIPGWKWTVEQHIGCFIGGVIAGCGFAGAAAYVACLLVMVDDNRIPVVN